jgi:hypothetical protein
MKKRGSEDDRGADVFRRPAMNCPDSGGPRAVACKYENKQK